MESVDRIKISVEWQKKNDSWEFDSLPLEGMEVNCFSTLNFINKDYFV